MVQMLDKEKILEKIAEIDETKRSIRRQIRTEGENAKKDRRQVAHRWMAKAKDKISYLIEDRDALRLMLGGLKARQKENNRLFNRSTKNDEMQMLMHKEFFNIAKEQLSVDVFDLIYDEAMKRTIETITA